MSTFKKIILGIIWWIVAAFIITLATDDYGNTREIAICVLTITLPFLLMRNRA